jgi:hypothetical protein
MKIVLSKDSRDYSFQEKYGKVTEFPKEFRVKEHGEDFVQPPGDVRCTAISCCDIASDSTSYVYDIDDLFNRIPHDGTGANPRNALKETINNGLRLKSSPALPRMREWRSYWSAHTGNEQSPFNNCRSALMLANYPVACWSKWFGEWSWSSIMTRGTNVACNHMYTISGWTEKYGVPMLVIDAWTGREMYMSEAVFNELATTWGFGTAVLATDEVFEKRTKTMLEAIVDGLQNLVLGLQEFIKGQKK